MATYRDIKLNFAAHPGTGDVSVVADEASVAQSIRSLVMTNPGERFFQPAIGGGIQALLFDIWSPLVQNELEERIRTTIENYEPRATLIDVTAEDHPERNFVNVSITYRTKTSVNDAKVNIALERVF